MLSEVVVGCVGGECWVVRRVEAATCEFPSFGGMALDHVMLLPCVFFEVSVCGCSGVGRDNIFDDRSLSCFLF